MLIEHTACYVCIAIAYAEMTTELWFSERWRIDKVFLRNKRLKSLDVF